MTTFAIVDGFRNWVAGLGKAGTDKSVSNQYVAPVANMINYENLYRTSAFGRAAISIPAGDMTREWRKWNMNSDEMRQAEKKLKLRKLCKKALIEGAKQGGAAIFIGIKGVEEEALEEPLDASTVGKDELEYLTLLTRHELTVVEHETDPLSPRYRMGRFYSINRGSRSSGLRIHWTRFAWFGGNETSSEVAETQDGWDDSVYATLQPLVESADSALANMLALIHEARTEVLKIDNLASYFEDEESEAKLARRVMTTQHMKSTLHMMVVDGAEDYISTNQTFSGVTEVFKSSLESLAGAADIPVTRFLGTAPKGMNSTGESDLRNYYDSIAARQENELADAIALLDEVLFRHATGTDPDDMDLSYEWNPLWQLSEKDKAEVEERHAKTDKILVELGILDEDFLAAAILSRIKASGMYPDLEQLLEEMTDETDAIRIAAPVKTVGGPSDPDKAKAPS